MRRELLVTAAMLGVIAYATAQANASPIVFGFEDQTATSPPFNGALSSLVLNQSGLSVTITRPGDTFDIVNAASIGGFPSSYGARALSPFSSDTLSTPFIADFSQIAAAVSLDMGDFGQDVDNLVLEAYSGLGATGTLLATATGSLAGGSTFTATSLSVLASGIRSIRFTGGSQNFPTSVYFDNLAITVADTSAVPEPGTLALLTLGGVGVAIGRVRRRKQSA